MEAVYLKRRCPKCKKGHLDHRTARGFLVKTLLFWLPIRRYRCGSCNRKSYVFGSGIASKVDSGNKKNGI